MIELIEKYIDDSEYYQVLFTIATRFIESKKVFEKLIGDAEEKGMKIYIDDSGLENIQWDDITFDMIKMK
ncbi:hypothetical protein [Chryseobacterium salviniae]|uniref:Uncharacterized protein n=1 Tax=Chryseobacterium salviniae TaxID=3101750 RepID=A0ABU6HTD1_9FLAO|nr:hypothetical protein [Chryseobacterium sp. T9W2-O]MEC3875951.1 hypothetical protein [Chryseobacterium sp. T9W2-O]